MIPFFIQNDTCLQNDTYCLCKKVPFELKIEIFPFKKQPLIFTLKISLLLAWVKGCFLSEKKVTFWNQNPTKLYLLFQNYPFFLFKRYLVFSNLRISTLKSKPLILALKISVLFESIKGWFLFKKGTFLKSIPTKMIPFVQLFTSKIIPLLYLKRYLFIKVKQCYHTSNSENTQPPFLIVSWECSF